MAHAVAAVSSSAPNVCILQEVPELDLVRPSNGCLLARAPLHTRARSAHGLASIDMTAHIKTSNRLQNDLTAFCKLVVSM